MTVRSVLFVLLALLMVDRLETVRYEKDSYTSQSSRQVASSNTKARFEDLTRFFFIDFCSINFWIA